MERDEQGRVVYQLKKPITVGSDSITELRIRDVQAGDLRELPTDTSLRTLSHVFDVIGKVAGQPKTVVDRLGIDDLTEVSSIVGAF
jgi:hypothetical protein